MFLSLGFWITNNNILASMDISHFLCFLADVVCYDSFGILTTSLHPPLVVEGQQDKAELMKSEVTEFVEKNHDLYALLKMWQPLVFACDLSITALNSYTDRKLPPPPLSYRNTKNNPQLPVFCWSGISHSYICYLPEHKKNVVSHTGLSRFSGNSSKHDSEIGTSRILIDDCLSVATDNSAEQRVHWIWNNNGNTI